MWRTRRGSGEFIDAPESQTLVAAGTLRETFADQLQWWGQVEWLPLEIDGPPLSIDNIRIFGVIRKSRGDEVHRPTRFDVCKTTDDIGVGKMNQAISAENKVDSR